MRREQGISLVGTIFLLAIAGFVLVVGFKLVPAYIEYFSVKKVLKTMAQSETKNATVAELKKSFDRRASADYIDSVKADDLDITKENGMVVISATWSKKVPLVANVSAVVDFTASSSGD
jgi:hypothetical protein